MRGFQQAPLQGMRILSDGEIEQGGFCGFSLAGTTPSVEGNNVKMTEDRSSLLGTPKDFWDYSSQKGAEAGE